MNSRNLVFGGVVLLMVLMVAASLRAGSRGGSTVTRMDAQDAALVSAGQRIYVAQCASCHGANLEGQANWQQPNADGSRPAPPHDASGHTWHHNDMTLFQIVKQGGQAVSPSGYKNNMPAFGATLSDQEIWAVLSYIKSTWPAEIQSAQEKGHG